MQPGCLWTWCWPWSWWLLPGFHLTGRPGTVRWPCFQWWRWWRLGPRCQSRGCTWRRRQLARLPCKTRWRWGSRSPQKSTRRSNSSFLRSLLRRDKNLEKHWIVPSGIFFNTSAVWNYGEDQNSESLNCFLEFLESLSLRNGFSWLLKKKLKPFSKFSLFWKYLVMRKCIIRGTSGIWAKRWIFLFESLFLEFFAWILYLSFGFFFSGRW